MNGQPLGNGTLSGCSLQLNLAEFERDPSGQEVFVSLEVQANAGSFSGRSKCVVLQRDLASFLDDLEASVTSLEGEARLVGGWGESEYVQLRFTPSDSLGHIAIRVDLSDHDPEADLRFGGTFISEPQALERSCQQIRRALRSQQIGQIELYVSRRSVT